MEMLGCGILGQPRKNNLRALLRSGQLSASAFADDLQRIVLGALMRRIGEARGVLERPDAGCRLRSTGRAQHDTAILWPEARAGLTQLDTLRLLRMPDGLREWDLADDVWRKVIQRLESNSAGGRAGPQAIAPLDLGSMHERLLRMRASVEVDRDRRAPRFALHDAPRTSRRRRQGSFYTPDSLIQHVLDAALEPAMMRVIGKRRGDDAATALLNLRICDPACGAGHFLVAAANRMAVRLNDIRIAAGARDDTGRARRDVIEKCIFGVDLDPLAVEIARAALWLEAGDAALDPRRLHANTKCGHALLGANAQFAGCEAHARLKADAWCAALTGEMPARRLNENILREIAERPEATDESLRAEIARIAQRHRFFHWRLEFPDIFSTSRGGFDVIIGNPPFLNQLESATASTRGAAAVMRECSGGSVRGYADTASAFLLLASEMTRPGGFFALVQPQSLLAARDAQPVRRAVLKRSALRSLWVANEHVFEAGVFVCAPSFEAAGARRGTMTRSTGAAFSSLAALPIDNDLLGSEKTWSHLVAQARGVPAFKFVSARVLGDIATATADFRDQYYGLDGFIVEDADLSPAQRRDRQRYPPLVTTGLIDLAANHWGRRPTRVLKRVWQAPRIDRRRLERETDLGPWIASRLVPKVLLATQTRVIEVFVDERGEFVPLVPLVTIVPRDPQALWRVAAALASPLCAAIALRDFGGTAMSAGAIKLAAKQVAQLPCPSENENWDVAASLLHRASSQKLHASLRADLLSEMAETLLNAASMEAKQRVCLLEWWQHRVQCRSARRDHVNQ